MGRKKEKVIAPALAAREEPRESWRPLLPFIAESSSDAIFIKDLDGIVTGWNEAASRIFGYSAEEMIGKPLPGLIPEEMRAEEDANLERALSGERVEDYRTVRLRKSGERLAVSVGISPLRDGAGTVIGSAHVSRDISDALRCEEDSRRLAAIVESSEDAIISKDLKGIVASWNDGAHRIFGYTAEEMIGQPILRIIPPELHGAEMEILRRLQTGEKIERFETTRVHKDGQTVEVSVTISPMKNAAGRIVGAAKIAHDISERKRMERQLIRSEKLAATGRMAATVAHEINNPLESVLNFVYLARRGTSPNEKPHSYLLAAEGELDRVSQIIRRILGYYSEAGRKDEVFLRDILVEALAVYQAQLHSSGISVDCRYEDYHRIGVHWNEFSQVFSTLLSDSIQVLPRGGSIRFDVEEQEVSEQTGIQVAIRLRAPGVEREILDRAFEPLAAVQSKISSSIGLSLARELLEKRGAQVTCRTGNTTEFSDANICIFVPFA